MPSTWRMYGVDANGDGVKDPYNPVDAMFAAARYLKAAGADQDIRRAVFAYNHADWYVDSVMLRAQVIGGLPSNLVGSLTGLTQGRFPVQARATYAGQLKARAKKVREGNAAMLVESTGRRGIKIFSRERAPAVAVNDGRIVAIGTTKRLGRYVKLQDVYGNTYTYGNLDSVAKRYPAPKAQDITAPDSEPEQQPTKRRGAVAAGFGLHRAGRQGARPQAGRQGHARGPQGAAQSRVHREAAPVREPGAPERLGRRRRAAGVRADRDDRRRRDVQGLLRARPRSQPRRGPAQAPAPRRPRRRRHDPRPPRQAGRPRGVPAVRDPPGRPRRPARGPEADPRRLEAPRVDGHLPGQRQEPVLRRRRGQPVDRPDPADEQGGADPARPHQPADRHLRVRPPGRPCRPDRPPRPGHARVPGRLRAAADGHRAQVRPLVPDDVRQRVRALDRHGRRHRARSTASRSRRRPRARARSPR